MQVQNKLRVEGQFEIKDLVAICNLEGVRLGVGRADCTAKELRYQIKEHKLTEKGGKGFSVNLLFIVIIYFWSKL